MCKREKGGGREGEGQVLRTVGTRDICGILCFYCHVCPPVEIYIKNLWIFSVNVSLSKIKLLLFFFPSSAFCVLRRYMCRLFVFRGGRSYSFCADFLELRRKQGHFW